MLRYNIRTGVKKIKTKTGVAISGASLASIGLIMALVMPLAAKATGTYTVFGSATQQSDGVHLLSDSTTHPYSGATLNLPSGTTVSNLSNLSLDYQVLQGHCVGGSQRFSVVLPGINRSIFIYVGTSPNFDSCPSGSTGNLISDADSRVDTTQIGGTFYDTWANAKTLVGSETIQSLSLVVDGGWSVTQEFLLTSATVNTTTYNFVPVPTKDDCKNNGWHTMTDANGKTFKNQGDCVSYFATNFRNPANGQ